MNPYRTNAKPVPSRPKSPWWRRLRYWFCERFDGGHLFDYKEVPIGHPRHVSYCWKCGLELDRCLFCEASESASVAGTARFVVEQTTRSARFRRHQLVKELEKIVESLDRMERNLRDRARRRSAQRRARRRRELERSRDRVEQSRRACLQPSLSASRREKS